MAEFYNKHIVLGVTGGIAAYKSADLVRRLRERGATVRVVMTQAATKFITPLTLQSVSGHPVHEDLFDPKSEAAMGHIELARWADMILIAPATADCIAKLAQGQANDLLTSICLARQKNVPVWIAPAMNQQMWQDAITQENLASLHQRDIVSVGPGDGEQACGEVGAGRMLEPIEIADLVFASFSNGSLSGLQLVLTAGPTIEPIDPVRFLSNHSSGKMAYALAQALVEADARVTLISGPTQLSPPDDLKFISVMTAKEMLAAVLDNIVDCDIFIGAAAVADYAIANPSEQKLAKADLGLTLQLKPNPDIIATVANLESAPFTVGFAAQTHDVIEQAKDKLVRKNLAMIVANQVGLAGSGFGSDDNTVTVIWPDGQLDFESMAKTKLARELVSIIAARYHNE